MADEIPTADRVWAVLRYVGVTPEEEQLLRAELPADVREHPGATASGSVEG